MQTSVAFATSREYRDLTEDDLVAARALERAGCVVHGVLWNDPSVPWADYDAVVVRSCWDYHLESTAFRAWIDACVEEGVHLLNDAPVLHWNLDKARYLPELEQAGHPVVPTLVLRRNESHSIADLLRSEGWAEGVIKPAISLSAHRTWRCDAGDAHDHQADLDALLRDCDVLLQEYQPQIVAQGEWSLMYFEGEFTHAVLKKAKPGDFRVQSDHGGTVQVLPPPAAMLATADAVVEECARHCLYARVDLVQGAGGPLLMEIELIDPQLFFPLCPASADRMASGLLARLRAKA